ncbi:unnamed protein product [Phaedon cochleariae]|uniref:GDP-fucose protein O-fucosyltransferase 2 n=1 Tax=Phaedon cochleariae TaxID=80249 RepID=A0A9N9X600_PHACE|nr:unnamed protein product [Phaedon cochleariae]
MWFKFATVFQIVFICSNAENFCQKNSEQCGDEPDRFLLYDVNRPEGFNLRRDVYMRFAVLAHNMQQSANIFLNKFKLVLPPWSYLVHWDNSGEPEYIPWGLYFDLRSLQMFAPVIEMHEFFNKYPRKYSKLKIDEVYTLQHFENMFETGNFEDRMKIEKCLNKPDLTFFFYDNITAKHAQCLSYHGPATKLTELFLNNTAKTILIDHAEVALHDFFGNNIYWQARRSMRFSKDLKKIAGNFRQTHLNSHDDSDGTSLPENWTDEQPRRNALGGPYVGIHLRRRDFIRNRPNESPSIKDISQQLLKELEKTKLDTVFLASDGSQSEFEELSLLLSNYKIIRYNPPVAVIKKYGDGGIAIIDQIICSHARFFIGTHESTFSFRIQEEREILGFPVETTFNAFCKNKSNCSKPSIWKIVY